MTTPTPPPPTDYASANDENDTTSNVGNGEPDPLASDSFSAPTLPTNQRKAYSLSEADITFETMDNESDVYSHIFARESTYFHRLWKIPGASAEDAIDGDDVTQTPQNTSSLQQQLRVTTHDVETNDLAFLLWELDDTHHSVYDDTSRDWAAILQAILRLTQIWELKEVEALCRKELAEFDTIASTQNPEASPVRNDAQNDSCYHPCTTHSPSMLSFDLSLPQLAIKTHPFKRKREPSSGPTLDNAEMPRNTRSRRRKMIKSDDESDIDYEAAQRRIDENWNWTH
ncbi:hypothetical protein H4582DRAFT_2084329 [Lactarius indigo]|nr:hypothetical protein H4582DRAFT_2084329 [Lactarius indigo]